MYWQKVPLEALQPKYVLNGFPKSGLHLCELMVTPLVKGVLRADLFHDNWVGTFRWNAWTNEWLPMRTITYRIARVQAGRYVKGHIGHKADLEQFVYLLGAALVFIYRDLRDVAVSQAHHILNPDDVKFEHPNKQAFQELGSFDAVLLAVLEGLGRYPGIVERWEQYAPWLDCEWVCKMPFEMMVEEPESAAATMLEYGLRRTAAGLGLEMRLDEGNFEQMVGLMAAAGRQTHASPTFRSGQVGGWREVWAEEHQKAFEERGGMDWVERLGYETDDPAKAG